MRITTIAILALMLASCNTRHTVTIQDGGGKDVAVAYKTDSATGTMDREMIQILCRTVVLKLENAGSSFTLDKNCQFILIKDPASDGFCVQLNYLTPGGPKNALCKWDNGHHFLSMQTF